MRLITLTFCMNLCVATSFANTQGMTTANDSTKHTFTYPIKNVAKGFGNYENALFYYSANDVFNLRNFAICESKNIVDFKINPSGSSFVLITGQGNKYDVAIYDLYKSDSQIARIKNLTFTPLTACYSNNASELYLSGSDACVHIYNPITGRPSVETLSLKKPANKMYVSGDGRYMAALHDNEVEVWNMVDHTLRRVLTESSNVKQAEFSKDGKWLANLTEDGILVVYDTSTLEVSKKIDGLGDAIACSIHPEGKHIAVATGTNRISIINLMNLDEREYLETETTGITTVTFVKNSGRGAYYLFYNGDKHMALETMNHLSPLRSKLIADILQSRMNEWAKQLPGETLEEYSLRVNEKTRSEQLKLFGQEIATEMALAEVSLSDMQIGAYDANNHLLAIDLGDKLPDIYLNVEADDLPTFMEASNLEFRNVKYGLNSKDEFEIIYADVYNRANGKTYTYNNMEGQFLEYLTDESTFIPLELIQQSIMEENTLANLKKQVMNQAKEESLISDHTNIQVNARVVSATDANGRNIQNYQVGVSYTVDQEFSARDDYASGKYKIEDSHAGTAMLKIVKQALEGDFAKYVKPSKRLKVKISGTADASPIRGTIKYDGCYGDFVMQQITNKGTLSNITVKKAEGISDNNQLAFMRAAGVKDYMVREIPAVSTMQTEYEFDIAVSDQEGSEYRKVGVELTFEDAF